MADDKKYIVDAVGQVRSVSDKEEQDRLAREGREFVSQQEARQAYQQELDAARVDQVYGTAGTAAMGGFSGLTLGLGPAAASALVGAFDPNTGEQLKHDIAAMQGRGSFIAGEALGTIAPALLSGGESLAARGLVGRTLGATPAALVGEVGGAAERLAMRLLPESTGLLGKAGTSVLGLAARGASEAALMNVAHQVGQNIIHNKPLTAEAIAAAEEGALFGGLLGGGVGAVGAGVGKIADVLGSKAGSLATKGAGRAEAMVVRELGGGAEDVAVMTKQNARTLREAVKEYGEVKNAAGESIGQSLGKGTREVNRVATEAIENHKTVQRGIAEILDKEAVVYHPSMNRIVGRVMDEVITPKMATYNQDIVAKVGQQTTERILNAFQAPEGKVWTKLLESRDQLYKEIESTMKGLDPSFIKSIKADVMRVVDHEIAESMQAAAKAIGRDGLAESFNSATIAQRTAEHIAEMTSGKLASDAVNLKPLVTPQDLAIAFGGASFGHPLFAAGMLAAKASTKMIEQRVAPRLAEMAYNMSVGGKAASATFSVKGRIKNAVTSFFKGTKQAANYGNARGFGTVKSVEDYDKHMERAHQLLSPAHQAKVREYAMQVEAAGQAELAARLLQVNQRAVQYLLQNLPASQQSKGAAKLGPLPKRESLEMKEFKFMRLFGVVDDPLQMIDKMASGEVSRDEVMAMKYVYPELHAELVTQTADAIQEMKAAGEFLPADKIATLGIVLDAPVDTTLTKEFIDGVQASMVPPPPPQASPPPDQGVMVAAQDLRTPIERTMV